MGRLGRFPRGAALGGRGNQDLYPDAQHNDVLSSMILHRQGEPENSFFTKAYGVLLRPTQQSN